VPGRQVTSVSSKTIRVDEDHRKTEDAGWRWQLIMSSLRVTAWFKLAILDREEMSNVT
jgi:hypothetical protein